MRQPGFFRPKLRRRGASDEAGVTIHSFRRLQSLDPGGAAVSGTTRVHIAGLVWGGPAGMGCHNIQGGGSGQMLVAVPEIIERDATIDRLITRTNGTVGTSGTPRLKMGVWANSALSAGSFAGWSYPGARLGQSGDLNLWLGSANAMLETLLSVSVSEGDLVWFGLVVNAQAASNQHAIPGLAKQNLFPIHGFAYQPVGGFTIANDAATASAGWRHAITYTGTEDLPDPFPSSAPALLSAGSALSDVNIPAVGFTFQ